MAMGLGIFLIVYGLQYGLIGYLPIALVLFGAQIFYTGIENLKKLRSIEAQLEIIREHGESIVQEAVKVKEDGGKVIYFLIDKGLTDRQVRKHVLEWVDQERAKKDPFNRNK